jgi:hypothetical protein
MRLDDPDNYFVLEPAVLGHNRTFVQLVVDVRSRAKRASWHRHLEVGLLVLACLGGMTTSVTRVLQYYHLNHDLSKIREQQTHHA